VDTREFPQLVQGASVDPAQRPHFPQLRAEATFPVLTVRPVRGVDDTYVLVCSRHGIASLPDGYEATTGAVCQGCVTQRELDLYTLRVRLLEGRH
jgi:hypothetical protein